MSSAPTISSATVGVQLPSFEITKEISDGVAGRRSIVVPVHTRTHAPATSGKSFHWRPLYSQLLVVLLVVCNVCLFAVYLFSVNGLEGAAYSLRQAQSVVEQRKGEQRQLQVRMAEAAAVVRTKSVADGAQGFVPVGTPEFIKGASAEALSMR